MWWNILLKLRDLPGIGHEQIPVFIKLNVSGGAVKQEDAQVGFSFWICLVRDDCVRKSLSAASYVAGIGQNKFVNVINFH